MSDSQLALTLLLTPLVSAVLIGVFFRKQAAIAKALSLTAATAIALLAGQLIFGTPDFTAKMEWLTIGKLTIHLGFLLDPLSKLLLTVVALVGLLVHVFSLGYMKGEENQARFFGCLSLFMFSMTGLTLADDLIMLFIFWELVGLSSFLLINFYFEKPSAVAASKKAFIVNRLGDFGFLLGIILAYWAFGTITLADIAAKIGTEPSVVATSIALLIFCGAVGKSGQLPFHVWLPDAMEGPTPVSALIHAATMVAAGIFLLCRVSVLMTGDALTVILWIGVATALFAGFTALGQRDLKRILAYSTISQLGFMVAAFALGSLVALQSGADVSLAGITGGVAAAMFHLTTHAFFKALLFLGSGSVLHGTHHEGDIYRLGGLAKKMPVTFATFTLGTLALVGCPLLAGFYSKDAILILAYQYSPVVFGLLLLGAFLTAFYMTRLWTTAFLGKARSEGSDHAHECGPFILLPLIVLAIGSVLGGFAWFYPEALRVVPTEALALLKGDGHTAAMVGGTATFVIGSALGFLLYRPGSSSDFLQVKLPLVYQLFEKRLYIDTLYDWYVAKVQQRFALLLNYIDLIVLSGIVVRGTAGVVGLFGLATRALHTGSLHTYVYWFLGGAVLLWAIASGVL
ncbi:MAG: NADH-quinone oxidoreductase subunit L [Opitutaceae bacterium]|jgi:NADH-quinone oxidoreductase subunit L|nr:NADH-quinone oxidoreductase subunit L [Opitutaceae bacterium]